MQKIILFYKFYPVADPDTTRLWQKNLAAGLNLRGRILISEHGINGTLGGDIADLKAYIRETKQFKGFKDTVFKWSDGGREDFPRLSIKVRPEIVSFAVGNELRVDETGVVGGGIHLKPTEVNELVNRYGDEVVFFDGRNAYEAAIGRFKNAVVPDTTTSKDFIRELDSGRYDHLKGKKVVTYCTGGIRCEILTPLMKNRGFREVYQMDGGIAKYGEKYGDDGLWEGSLYVFDKRMGVKFSDHAKDIGDCSRCGNKTSNFENCADVSCNKLMVLCEACAKDSPYCSDACRAHVETAQLQRA